MTVKAYRNLASNVLQSVHKGDATVACGILSTEEWKKDGSDYSRVILEASSICHNLNRGTTQLTKHANQSNSNQSNNINKTGNDNIKKSNSNSQSVNKEFDSDLDI